MLIYKLIEQNLYFRIFNTTKVKLLITGYNGFVGTNLTKFFSKHHLIGIDLTASSSVNQHFNWSDLDSIEDIDAIIHLAGKAHDTRNIEKTEDYFRINLGLTKKIYDYFIKSDAKRFIFFSSVKAIADTVKGDVLTEEDSPSPLTPYGQSKLAAENYILSKSIPSSKRIYILRPCMIHGPGNKGNLNLLYNIVQMRLPWPLGAYENLRSFTSIDNLMFIIQRIIETDVFGGIYQVADDDPLSNNELIKLMANSLERKSRIWRIPKGIIRTATKVGDIIHTPLNNERLRKLTESYIVSNSKLKYALGISRLPVTSRVGLIKTLESLKSKKH